MPEISIIIPVYQGEKTIKKCLDSIFNQSYTDFEVILVNDGSTDRTLEVIEPYQNRLKLISYQNNRANPNIARNRGYQEASGQYLLFCDDDIEMQPDLLAKMKATLDKHLQPAYTYSSFYFGRKKFRLWPFDAQRLRQMPYIHTCSLIRREYFPGFDINIKKLQDWDLWLTMLTNKQTGIWIPEFLFKVNPKKDGISSWLPKAVYKIPWQKFGIKIKSLEKYREAEEIIKQKHNL